MTCHCCIPQNSVRKQFYTLNVRYFNVLNLQIYRFIASPYTGCRTRITSDSRIILGAILLVEATLNMSQFQSRLPFFLYRKACVALINMGAEVDSLDNLHQTPLMWSVKKNQVKCAEVLLDYKASVDLQDADGDCALHLACGKSHAAIVSLLLDRGASLTSINGRGHDCLEVAAKAGASDVAMTIVKHKRLVFALEDLDENNVTKTNIIIHL